MMSSKFLEDLVTSAMQISFPAGWIGVTGRELRRGLVNKPARPTATSEAHDDRSESCAHGEVSFRVARHHECGNFRRRLAIGVKLAIWPSFPLFHGRNCVFATPPIPADIEYVSGMVFEKEECAYVCPSLEYEPAAPSFSDQYPAAPAARTISRRAHEPTSGQN